LETLKHKQKETLLGNSQPHKKHITGRQACFKLNRKCASTTDPFK